MVWWLEYYAGKLMLGKQSLELNFAASQVTALATQLLGIKTWERSCLPAY